MTTVKLTISNLPYLELLRAIFEESSRIIFSGDTIAFPNKHLARLVERFVKGRSSVLPYVGSDRVVWIILGGTDGAELDRTVERAARFVVPTYALFDGESARRLAFDPSQPSVIQHLGAKISPHGYYQLLSSRQNTTPILERLDTWLSVEAYPPRPASKVYSPHTASYFLLYRQFLAALAGKQWSIAEGIIVDVQRLLLTTAENISFLRIQLLAEQHEWLGVWNYLHRSHVVTGRVPRHVRGALITGFYVTFLAQFETSGDWRGAFDAFQRHSADLGKLLTTREGLTNAPVLHVFGYQAVFEGNSDEFARLREAMVEPETIKAFGSIALLFPPPSVPVQRSASERAKEALYLGRYDDALAASYDMSDSIEGLAVRIRVASEGDDVALIHEIVAQSASLYPEDQARLTAFNLTSKLDLLRARAAPGPKTGAPIETWHEWFTIATGSEGATAHLNDALARLRDRLEQMPWSIHDITALTGALENALITIDGRWRSGKYAQVADATRTVTAHFLRQIDGESSNPALNELFEVLYAIVIEQSDQTEVGSAQLLRLGEARLRANPGHLDSTFQHLSAWFSAPIPKYESLILEAFDLLGDYGLSAARLVEWYRRWMPIVIDRPTCDLTSVQVWRDYYAWIQPGDDLLYQLDQAKARLATRERDPIASLPSGTFIALYTLHPASAERAMRLLRDRNPDLDLRGFYETHPNEKMTSAAQKADKVIVVTSCITHAVTYAITPFASDRLVYPVSRGADSIIRALEDSLSQ